MSLLSSHHHRDARDTFPPPLSLGVGTAFQPLTRVVLRRAVTPTVRLSTLEWRKITDTRGRDPPG